MSDDRAMMSRRELLKILAAGGSAVAASAFVPSKWLKPLIKTGVIPAHAQASILSITASGELVQGDQINLSVTITPPVAGINMQASVNLTPLLNGTNGINDAPQKMALINGGGLNQILYGITNSSGTASFTITMAVCGQFTGSVVYSFVTPIVCSVCSLTRPLTIYLPCPPV